MEKRRLHSTHMCPYWTISRLRSIHLCITGLLQIKNMTPEQLEKLLAFGREFGFIKETDSPEYLEWIIRWGQKPLPVPSFEPGEDPERYRKWKEQNEFERANPYILAVEELRRDVYESDEYPETLDYRMFEVSRFATLDEVEADLQKYGKLWLIFSIVAILAPFLLSGVVRLHIRAYRPV
jgi:hypothetical protein